MIGFRPGTSPLHRAHPYTPLALAAALLVVVFALGTPAAVAVAVAAAVAFSLAGGVLGYTARPALTLGLALMGAVVSAQGASPLPFAAALLLAASEPAALRIAAATAFALAVPGFAPAAAVSFIALALSARHAPKAARWVLGDEQRSFIGGYPKGGLAMGNFQRGRMV